MARPSCSLTLVLLVPLCCVPLTLVRGEPHKGPKLTEAEAAELARQQSGGGRVLSLQPENGGYRAKVLTRSGEVRYEQIPAEREANSSRDRPVRGRRSAGED